MYEYSCNCLQGDQKESVTLDPDFIWASGMAHLASSDSLLNCWNNIALPPIQNVVQQNPHLE